MKHKLNIESDCTNMEDLPNIKIVLPYRKNYYSKDKIDHNNPNYQRNEENYRKELFGEFEIELTPEDYIIDGKKINKQKKEADNSEFKSLLDDETSDLLSESKYQCHAAFMAIDVPAPRGPLFVFGEYFLRKFYTVFDRDRLLIGFSESKEEDEENSEVIVTPYDKDIDKKLSKNLNINKSGLNKSSNKQNKSKKTNNKNEDNEEENNSKKDESDGIINLDDLEKELENIETDSTPDNNNNEVDKISSKNDKNKKQNESDDNSENTNDTSNKNKKDEIKKILETRNKSSPSTQSDNPNFETFLTSTSLNNISFLNTSFNLELN